MMKSLHQTSKYKKFLILSTLISCGLFALNLTVGFKNIKSHGENGFSSIILTNPKKSSHDDMFVKGDVPDDEIINTGQQLIENTPRYQIEQFWIRFMELIVKTSPKDFQIDSSRPESCKLETNLIDPIYDGEIYSEQFLKECLNINYKDYQLLQKAHSKFLKNMPKDYESSLANKYHTGNGIVIIGSGKYSVMTYLVLETMRSTGTTLPVEVFIPYGSDDDDFCSKIESLNAKCIRPIISEDLWHELGLQSYQIKALALISSSFENLLYLDSDSYPLQNVDHIFNNGAYQETGFVSWPDFWRRSTSPAFYKIAGISKIGKQIRNNIDSFSPPQKYATGYENLQNEIQFHDRAGTIPDGSSETSAIMINKNKHAQTLMLSFYYNFNGPNVFYELLTQGNFGQGDKETFIAAAHVLKKPYYQLKTKPEIGGDLMHGDKTPRGCSMIQFDVNKDYELYLEAKEKFGTISISDTKEHNDDNEQGYDVTKVVNHFNEQNRIPLFIHYNLNKFEPFNIHGRQYGKDLKIIGYDFEYRNTEYMHAVLCGDDETKIHFQCTSNANMDEICTNLANVLLQMGEESHQIEY